MQHHKCKPSCLTKLSPHSIASTQGKSNHMGNSIQPAIALSDKVSKKKETPQKNPQILFE
jgi:hypothetical protein